MPLKACDGINRLTGMEQRRATPSTRSAPRPPSCSCSPVYRASFPGVLKNALDLLPVEALRDKPVGIVAMGASDHHYLGVDSHLRSVLAWFGAIALPTSVYLKGADFAADGSPSSQAVEMLATLARSLIELAERVRGVSFGPPPLAARV